MWIQKQFALRARSRGFHIVTSEILSHIPELSSVSVGILHVFILHTSASLTINENADPDVRVDMESHFNVMIPERAPYFEHTFEGSDDMPADLKTSILGSSVTIPISKGRLALGSWQGIYLTSVRYNFNFVELASSV